MHGTRHLFIDPSLRGSGGHHLVLAQDYAARAAPQEVRYAVHRRADRLPGLPDDAILRMFASTMTEASRLRRYGRLGQRLVGLGETMGLDAVWRRRSGAGGVTAAGPPRAARDAGGASSLHIGDLLAACAAFAPQEHDLIAFDSGDAEQGLAAAELLESGRAGGARLHFRLMYDDISRYPTDFTWRSVVRRLTAAAGASSVAFSTETAAFAAALRDATGCPVAVRPHPSRLTAMPAPGRAGPFVLFVPGEARSDKGVALLQGVIDRLPARLRGAVLIRVQAPIDGPMIARLPHRLSEDAYAEAWASCHAALLLHDPVVYALRGSGVVCDAVASGRPFICLEGASPAEWTRDGNGLVVPSDTASIATAIEDLATGYAGMLQHADEARERLRILTQSLGPSHDLP